MNQNEKTIKQFIANIANKNYSEANKSLGAIIENKLKDRIKSCLDLKK